jgi:hypothetical protein
MSQVGSTHVTDGTPPPLPRSRAVVDGGLGQAEVVVLRVPVGVEQPVRDGLDPEPLAGAAGRHDGEEMVRWMAGPRLPTHLAG